MPGRDRTGPMGFGPMTGRGMGWCGRPWRGFSGFGRGRMFGWGYARGWRNRFGPHAAPGWMVPGRRGWWGSPPPDWRWGAESELDELREYAAGLEEELNQIKARMTELEKEQKAAPPEVKA